MPRFLALRPDFNVLILSYFSLLPPAEQIISAVIPGPFIKLIRLAGGSNSWRRLDSSKNSEAQAGADRRSGGLVIVIGAPGKASREGQASVEEAQGVSKQAKAGRAR